MDGIKCELTNPNNPNEVLLPKTVASNVFTEDGKSVEAKFVKVDHKTEYMNASELTASLFGFGAQLTLDLSGYNNVLAVIPRFAFQSNWGNNRGVASVQLYNDQFILRLDANNNSEYTVQYDVIYTN